MSFRRALTLFDTTMMVVGGVIGAGIFITPFLVAQRLPSGGLVLAAWMVGGGMALAGAFAYAELGSLFPRAGGQYVYLSEAYHPLVGFLYGWALLFIINTGAMAAVALTFAEYALRLAGVPGTGSVLLAIAAIVAVTAVNYAGVKPGSQLLNVFVVLKIAALAVLIGAGLIAGGSLADAASLEPSRAAPASLLVAFGWALVPVLFSYGGWQLTNFVAEEIHDPTRTLPRALLLGSAIIVSIYLAMNLVYLAALGHDGLAATLTPAADTARRLLGAGGDRFIAASIAISTFGFLDMAVLAAARVYYAMAADGYLMPSMKRLHPRYRTPTFALLVQMAWAIVLLLTGTYGQLLDYVVFADWIFFGLSVAAVFVFRRRLPLARRPPGTFRAAGYPLVPALFVTVSAAVVASVVWASPAGSAAGAALLAIGMPVFWYYSRTAREA